MTPSQDYLHKCHELLKIVSSQEDGIHQAAELFSQTILSGRMVHVFGSGHSRIMVEEMWPRYGSFPGFNPIVELSLSFHNLVVGANGQRQAMFLENVSGGYFLFHIFLQLCVLIQNFFHCKTGSTNIPWKNI